MEMNKIAIIVSILLLSACTNNQITLPDKALFDTPIIADAIQDEKDINAHDSTKAPDNENWFKVIDGNSPIIVTAPHATQPFRDGKYRFSDGGGTAALAIALHKLTGVSIIYTTYASPSDPNYYDDNEFKRALKKLIVQKKPLLLLDLHGSHAYRPYEVDLGTMRGRSLVGKEYLIPDLIKAFHNEGIENISYNYFGASKYQTVTKFSAGLGVPAIQVEINSTRLIPDHDELSAHLFSQLLEGLARFIEHEQIPR